MFNLLLLIIIMIIISVLLLMINFLISKKTIKNREKISPFECGFDPLSNNRLPFSTHFFLISLIFLIFDIEITLLIPSIYSTLILNKYFIYTIMIFIIILIVGLFLEYMEKSIDWKT